MTIKPEIDIRGMNVDEATIVIDKYLDDAYISNLASVRIIHGKGTGALKKGILNFLKSNSPMPKSLKMVLIMRVDQELQSFI